MKNGVAKNGRKFAGEAPGEMVKVAFRIDPETWRVFEQLVADVEPSIVHGRKSIALRRAILVAAGRRK